MTENQPNAYLARLPLDERPAVLLFVAPEARLATIWPELRRLIQHPFNWQPVDWSHGTEINCALVDDQTRFLVLASWRGLLDRMLSFSMTSGDSIEADIRQLRALCEQQDQDAFLPLKPHELAPEIPRRTLQFNQLVDDAVELARERNVVNTDGLKVTPRPHGYGRYMRLGGKEVDVWAGAWFGVDYTLWSKYRDTPLWITFYSDNRDDIVNVDKLRDTLGNDIWANTPRSIPVYLPTGVEYGKVLADVVECLVDIANRIAV